MKNLAILIGVADYKNIIPLPPCKNDVTLINNILKASKKYDDILLLSDSPKSLFAKEQITEFIKQYQNDQIDEVLVYYTGHGSRIKDDFIYLFSDFNEQKLEQTSLRNSEFDSMLKSLKPKLTVKVIDACQAGTEYIKSNQELQHIFDKSSKASFGKAYFLFSSSSEDSSMALHDYSVFTKSFVNSLLRYADQNIRYRDIMAFISDDIEVNKHQKPFFIVQADNTESFVTVSQEITEQITECFGLQNVTILQQDSEMMQDIKYSEEIKIENIKSNLVEKIKKIGINFCTEAEAQQSILDFQESINTFDWNETMSELFEVEFNFSGNTLNLSSVEEIAHWIEESEEDYFTEIKYRQESYEVNEPINPFLALAINTAAKTVTKYRDVISSYKLTAPSPFQSLIIRLHPKEEILSWYKIFITLIFSKVKLTIFYKFEVEKDINWAERIVVETNEWKSLHVNLKNIESIKKTAVSLLDDISKDIIIDIESKIS